MKNIGFPEIAALGGMILVAQGLWLIWPPLTFLFCGATSIWLAVGAAKKKGVR